MVRTSCVCGHVWLAGVNSESITYLCAARLIPGRKNRQPVYLFATPDPPKLPLKMLCWIGRAAFVVVVRFVIPLLREHVVDSLLSHRVQRLKGIAGGGIGGEEASIRPSETLPASPKTTT
jgi:hypothetical protein